jgi:hypothetical protein
MATFAVDIDGTVLSETVFPYVGSPLPDAIKGLLIISSLGHKIIVWTCREGRNLERVVEFLNKNGIYPDGVNENLENVVKERGVDSRKIVADYYLDDRSFPPFPGWTAFIQWILAAKLA